MYMGLFAVELYLYTVGSSVSEGVGSRIPWIWWMPESMDSQVPYIKGPTTVGSPYPQVPFPQIQKTCVSRG